MRIPFFKVVYGSDFSKGLNKVPGFQGGLWIRFFKGFKLGSGFSRWFMGESCFSRWFMGESDFQGGLWKN